MNIVPEPAAVPPSRPPVLIRERFPETRVFEYYRDIRTYGRGQEEYYERASKNQVIFLRFEPDAPPVVEAVNGSGHPLKVSVKDTLTFGEEIEAEVDLVVLSVGMEPNDITDLVEMMKLPVGNDRFLLEVHPKLRPVEVAKTGILLAGTCQAPMDISETCNAAQAASVKASALLTKGYVELDPYVAQVDLTRCCQGKGFCVEVCPVEGAASNGGNERSKAKRSDGPKSTRPYVPGAESARPSAPIRPSMSTAGNWINMKPWSRPLPPLKDFA